MGSAICGYSYEELSFRTYDEFSTIAKRYQEAAVRVLVSREQSPGSSVAWLP